MADTPIAGAAIVDRLINRIRFSPDEGGGGGDAGGDGDAGSGDDGSADGAGDGGADGAGAGDGGADGGDGAAGGDEGGDGAGDGGAGESAEGYWPDDWREKYIEQYKGKDGKPLEGEAKEKMLNRLGRYTSPQAAFDALINAQNKISEGLYKMDLPENATEEELTAYREANGIPEKPEGYDLTLDDGQVIGDEDKPIVDAFLKTAHESNMKPDQVKGALNWYYQHQEEIATRVAADDDQYKKDSVDDLRQEWGTDYRINVNAAEQFLAGLPGGLGKMLAGGRLADGTPIGTNPEALKAFAQLGRDQNPYTRVVPAEGDQAAKMVEEKIAGYEKRMKDDREAWFKDKDAQKHYQELINARDAAKGKAA